MWQSLFDALQVGCAGRSDHGESSCHFSAEEPVDRQIVPAAVWDAIFEKGLNRGIVPGECRSSSAGHDLTASAMLVQRPQFGQGPFCARRLDGSGLLFLHRQILLAHPSFAIGAVSFSGGYIRTDRVVWDFPLRLRVNTQLLFMMNLGSVL